MHFILLTIILCLTASTSAFLLKPSVYSPPPANHTICQSDSKDQANAPAGPNHSPYLTCTSNGHLKITACRLLLTNQATCPLNYPGAQGSRNFPVRERALIDGAEILVGTDCTRELTDLCNGQSECSFQWALLGNLQIETVNGGAITPVFERQQGARVQYTCIDKRDKCELNKFVLFLLK